MKVGLFYKTATLLAGLMLIGGFAAPAFSQAPGGVLKGRVEEQGSKTHNTLSRTKDVRQDNSDPFSGKEDNQMLDAPVNSFEPEITRPPQQQRMFPLSAGMGGQPRMAPANPMNAPIDMGGEPDAMPQQVQQQQPQQQPQFNPNDPDSSPDMQLLWDMWHKKVAGVIFERFNFFAKAAFRMSPPLTCKLSYAVTRDGHITNINMDQKSTNVLFNVLVFQCVRSLDGDAATLQFPQGSRRQYVQKYGTFAQNWGGAPGFKYTVNDKERLSGQQQQQQQRY